MIEIKRHELEDGMEPDTFYADASDLGWAPGEWPYLLVAHPTGGFANFRTALCGGAGFPLVWGRGAAFLGRIGQSLFDEGVVRMQIYVDDPLYIVRGRAGNAARELTLALLWASAAGFPLAWAKSGGGHTQRWIGAQLAITTPVSSRSEVEVSVPAEKAVELARADGMHRAGGWTGGRLIRTPA